MGAVGIAPAGHARAVAAHGRARVLAGRPGARGHALAAAVRVQVVAGVSAAAGVARRAARGAQEEARAGVGAVASVHAVLVAHAARGAVAAGDPEAPLVEAHAAAAVLRAGARVSGDATPPRCSRRRRRSCTRSGQHRSPPMHAEMGVARHWALHARGSPVSASMVHGSPSSQAVGQSPSQVSPSSTRPLPQGRRAVAVVVRAAPGRAAAVAAAALGDGRSGAGDAARLGAAREDVQGAGDAVVAGGRAVAVAGLAGVDDAVAAEGGAVRVAGRGAAAGAAAVASHAGVDGGVGAGHVAVGGAADARVEGAGVLRPCRRRGSRRRRSRRGR